MMIRLSSLVCVASDQITEITVSVFDKHAVVSTKDGKAHTFRAEYGQTIQEAVDKLMEKINAKD